MTAGLATTAAVLLALVFAVAAVTKLREPTRTSHEFRALGLPGARRLAVIVPLVEAATAAALVVRPRWGALVAAGLLLLFTAVLADALRKGWSVACGCLGSLSDEPVTVATLARNGVLLALAGLTVTAADWHTGPAAPSVAEATAVSLAVVLATVGVQLLALRQSIGRLWSVELAGEAPRRDRASRKGMEITT